MATLSVPTRHLIHLKSINKAENLLDHTYKATGTYEIGRGSLGISEKKCSRKQILIKLDEHSNYYLISNGINPSYLKKYDKDYFVQMTKDEEYVLEDGDSFSMLYEMLTFTVVIEVNTEFVDYSKKTSSSTASTTTSSNNKRKDIDDNNDDDTNEKDTNTKKQKSLPECPYGKSCYRKNEEHFKEFSHPWKDTKDSKDEKKTTTTTTTATNKKDDSKDKNGAASSTTSTTSATAKPTTTATSSSTTTATTTTTTTTSPPSTSTASATNNGSTNGSNNGKPNYKKKKQVSSNKQRSLYFPFISTFVYNFKVDIATDIAITEIKSYLEFHKEEDDIKLIMCIDKSIYNDSIATKLTKGVGDERFSIVQCDSATSVEQFNVGCRFVASETTWRLKRTPQNKQLYDIIGEATFDAEVKQRYPKPGTAGNIYAVPIKDQQSKAAKEFNIDAIFLTIGPNMNDKKSNYIEDIDDATPLLTQTYQSLFSKLDNYD
ncbi:hypothetical protein PPL_08045 [Heterostelium album PN500]|uniref:PBZ-type domain-containing protein n=1 Tax=Heterostelium pallidum (strain ATCC 26659 / Pp 5 / PN500) TaxID=670386 RepID=D3BHP0_HETP5|nr:hypothetical protein PPL_08045 [Heterostelium album PN500]EFA79217.1 hypothetical protein PPL_08045 [Heterostelium album PN500]|eukprot:XP_020431338.1 hypothetical protein PPL_08045 [Heterostelium album PN500]